jgi:hypothetical protein
VRSNPSRRWCYERQRTGELIHIEVKKLGRIEAVGHRITGDPTRHPARRRLADQVTAIDASRGLSGIRSRDR